MTLGVYSRTRGSLLSWISWFWRNRHTVFRDGDLFNLDEIRRDNVLCSAFDRNGRFPAKEMAQYMNRKRTFLERIATHFFSVNSARNLASSS
jgi:hypothetical protein